VPKYRYLWGWLSLPASYRISFSVGEEFFRAIFQYENALRLIIYNFLEGLYGPDWWGNKLKKDLPKIYEYARDREVERKKKPVFGNSDCVEILPIHYITLGLLNEIVITYKSECIPELFPDVRYFKRQAALIKKFRDLCFHVFPGIIDDDWTTVKGPINELYEHLQYRLR
jgi:hypothetical protein